MPIQTPICDFGQKAHDFKLKSTDNKIISLNDVKGENGTLIMFICNHCPYVKAVTMVTALTYGQWLQINMIKVPFSPLTSFREIILLSVDLSLKSCAFWPKSHIGVCIGIM